MKHLALKIGAAAGYVAMMVVNGLAGSTTVLGGRDTAAISDLYPNLFTPAGYTFAVWGFIYFMLAVFTLRIFQTHDEDTARRAKKILPAYIATSLINVSWLLCWQFNLIGPSTILMLGLLGTLIWINFQIHPADPTWMRVPFRAYLAWITVATIANITIFLVSINWNRFGIPGDVWMLALLFAGWVISASAINKFKAPVYGAVIVWAFGGILAKHASAQGWNGAYPHIMLTLVALIILLGAQIGYISVKFAQARQVKDS